jgi:hypothetical protein
MKTKQKKNKNMENENNVLADLVFIFTLEYTFYDINYMYIFEFRQRPSSIINNKQKF